VRRKGKERKGNCGVEEGGKGRGRRKVSGITTDAG
jgi:hypothetical protein